MSEQKEIQTILVIGTGIGDSEKKAALASARLFLTKNNIEGEIIASDDAEKMKDISEKIKAEKQKELVIPIKNFRLPEIELQVYVEQSPNKFKQKQQKKNMQRFYKGFKPK